MRNLALPASALEMAPPTARVRSRPPVIWRAGLPWPCVQLAIAVDTAFVAGAGNCSIGGGIYLMDNQLNGGSSGEGGFASLASVAPLGSLVGYTAYPLDTSMGDQVAITGFSVVEGDVFGCAGYPIAQRPDYWIAQAMNLGSQVYQVQLRITAGALRPTQFHVHVQATLRTC